MLSLLEGIAAQVEQQRDAEVRERLTPHLKGLAAVLQEDPFSVAQTNRNHLAVIVDVKEFPARRFGGPARQVTQHVVEVDVVGVIASVEFNAFLELFLDVWITGRAGLQGARVQKPPSSIDSGGEIVCYSVDGGYFFKIFLTALLINFSLFSGESIF